MPSRIMHARQLLSSSALSVRESVLELRAYGTSLELESDRTIWPDGRKDRKRDRVQVGIVGSGGAWSGVMLVARN